MLFSIFSDGKLSHKKISETYFVFTVAFNVNSIYCFAYIYLYLDMSFEIVVK